MNFLNWKNIGIGLLIIGSLIAMWVLICGGYLYGEPNPDPQKARDIQPFITGLVVPLLTLGSTLLILENLRNTTLQNFSNNFFKLIDLHNKLVDNIDSEIDDISTEENPSSKKGFFDDLAYRIANDFYCLSDAEYGKDFDVLAAEENLRERSQGKIGIELLNCIYDYHYHIHQSNLGHYFRNLYHLVCYAERAPLDKIEHIKILRAQLSNYEILMLAYNGLNSNGKKFYTLIEKYELLKNINTEKNLSSGRIKRIIPLTLLCEAYPHLKRHIMSS